MRVRISNERLNSYGTRVLTSGLDLTQFKRNPVLLYMHERGKVIGLVKDIEVEDGEVSGELVFDEATELSRQCKKQFEFGSLKMVSAGLDVLELSSDSDLLAEGQTKKTVTKSKLYEVSVVDIGSNDDALVLRKDGKTLNLYDNPCTVEWLEISEDYEKNKSTNKSEREMELKKLALQLGLQEGAVEADVEQKLGELLSLAKENEELKKEKAALELSRLTGMVDTAIAEKRIGQDKKEHFIELGKKIGADEMKELFDAMQPQVKLSALLPQGDGGQAPKSEGWKKLSDVPEAEMLKLRKEQPEEYARLYKAEYGIELD